MPPGGSSAAALDLHRQYKSEYVARREPAIVNVGPARYLVATGSGAPGGPEFQRAIGSLFGAAYALKFRCKALGHDFKVSGLEGLWESPPFGGHRREPRISKTPWRLLLRVPEFVGRGDLKATHQRTPRKGGPGGPAVTLERFREGTCVQMLHVGPYSKETATVQAMEASARGHGYALAGPLHEIYLSDPRRVAPTRLRTVLRVRVTKARPVP